MDSMWDAMYLHGLDVPMQSMGVYLMLGCSMDSMWDAMYLHRLDVGM